MLAHTENELLVEYPSVNIFAIFFELISAYGTVGTSLGFGTLSLSSAFTDFGKLLIIGTMILGKMRGMPTHTDIVIDFSFQTIANALRQHAAARGMQVSSPAPSACASLDAMPCHFPTKTCDLKVLSQTTRSPATKRRISRDPNPAQDLQP